jgi:hypothetical protein
MTYQYTELPPERLTRHLPCAGWMHWPGYDTKVIKTSIDGRDIIIQLWKGLFNIIPGISGLGAEIGIYHKSCISGLWWPDYKHKKNLSYTLINPITGEEFFTAGPDNVWWLHKWMTIPSYMKYKKNHSVPKLSTQYLMNYKINDNEDIW